MQLNQKLDVWDYSLNFSSEIIIGGLVLVVAAANIIAFNPLKADYQHSDSSLAAQILGKHSNLNTQLAAKQNTISTTVASSSLFSQAQASGNEVLASNDEAALVPEETLIDDSGITKPSPDSIQRLVSRQVQVYETKPFDTVYTVAEQFKVSPKTIRETNSLPNNALKAGWFLVIPPVDGLVIQVTNPNLTLTDVANAYSADINKIKSYNGLVDDEDMVDLNDYLVIPGGVLPTPKAEPKPTTPANPTTSTKRVTPSVPKATSISGNHKFAAGYCTDYVARKVPGIKWGGNANRWIANSKAFGATVDMNPVAGAIMVTNENSRYGHVAYIESVDDDGIHISEWNYAGLYKTTYRTFKIGDSRIKGIIHP